MLSGNCGSLQPDTVMLTPIPLALEDIYVPVKMRKTLDPDKVEALAESIIEEGQRTPVQVRRDKDRYVLVTGLHRIEALRALGEETVEVLIVGARQF